MAGKIKVPSGFVTDLASIPRIFWQIMPRDGKYIYPAIVHDYMYWKQDQPRDVADEIFRIGMSEFGVDVISVNAIYWAVRACGGRAWSQNNVLKGKGDKRVLKRLPDNPLITWESWKNESDVFL